MGRRMQAMGAPTQSIAGPAGTGMNGIEGKKQDKDCQSWKPAALPVGHSQIIYFPEWRFDKRSKMGHSAVTRTR
jgi:hypothetical protein